MTQPQKSSLDNGRLSRLYLDLLGHINGFLSYRDYERFKATNRYLSGVFIKEPRQPHEKRLVWYYSKSTWEVKLYYDGECYSVLCDRTLDRDFNKKLYWLDYQDEKLGHFISYKTTIRLSNEKFRYEISPDPVVYRGEDVSSLFQAHKKVILEAVRIMNDGRPKD